MVESRGWSVENRGEKGGLVAQIVGDLAETLFVFVVADDEEGMDDAGEPAKEGKHQAEEEAAQPPRQQHRQGREQDAEEEEHGAGRLVSFPRPACSLR